MTSDSTPAFEIEKEALKTEIETGIQAGVDHLEAKTAKRKDADKFHTIERDMESESNPKCRELQLDYYRLIQTIGSREAITRRFLVIFEYEAVTNRKPEYSEIVSALETTVQTARQYFLHCDNAVVTHDDENAFLLEILYTIFNRSTCEVKTVEQRIGELQSARRDADITMPVSLKSVFAPDSIDLTHGSYVVMDGVYHAYLIVPSDGYNPRVVAGWTSILVNAGEGIDVDFYFSREPKERIQAKLGQQIRINRSRLKDTSDTNSDFDDFESAIRSGYFLKEGLANYEDFYYCNTLVTVTADTLENLEWRISEVRRLMISQDMDIRICRFRQEQALLSILPFCKLDKKLFEASKRNSPLMFWCPRTNGYWSPDSLRHLHKQMLAAAGVDESVRFHDLRHTFSTLAIQSGVDAKTVAGMLGHYSAAFTLDTYTHVTEQMKRGAAEKIGVFMNASVNVQVNVVHSPSAVVRGDYESDLANCLNPSNSTDLDPTSQ